jgi:hypothetical protein
MLGITNSKLLVIRHRASTIDGLAIEMIGDETFVPVRSWRCALTVADELK